MSHVCETQSTDSNNKMDVSKIVVMLGQASGWGQKTQTSP